MEGPTLSIVMPVYDTGALLVESVRSIVAQTLFAKERAGYWELLIVDDASRDRATVAALAEAAASSPNIRVLANRRRPGAAGSRNTGIDEARGEWIGFLDSDDLWYPDFLERSRNAFVPHPDADWRAAHFDVGDARARVPGLPLSKRSPCLYRVIEQDYEAGRVSRLSRPVDVLLRCGCMQVMTVQVRRDLVRSMGGFDEALTCAEDYDLWLRLAASHDLHLAPIDAGVYRVRDGSLTKSDRPMYYCEDAMLLAAKAKDAFAPYRREIDRRLERVFSTYCWHFRARGQYADAARFALKLIRLGPARVAGWRHLAAIAVRR